MTTNVEAAPERSYVCGFNASRTGLIDEGTHAPRKIAAADIDRVDHFEVARIVPLEQRHQGTRIDIGGDVE